MNILTPEEKDKVALVLADVDSWDAPVFKQDHFAKNHFIVKADKVISIIEQALLKKLQVSDEKLACKICNNTVDGKCKGKYNPSYPGCFRISQILAVVTPYLTLKIQEAKKEERFNIQNFYQTKNGDIVIPKDDWQELNRR